MIISSKPLLIKNSDQTFTITEQGKRALDAQIETSEKMKQLMKDQVMGESSWRFGSMSEQSNFSVYQDSESTNDQWQFLNNSGLEGKQAAQYLVQMITEKRDLIDDYLKNYDVMTHELSFLVKADNLKNTDLESILNNVKAGRLAAQNADGSLLPQAPLINEFATQNATQLASLNAQSEQIYQQPKHLSHWLDQNNIDRPLSMDKLVDRSLYIGLNGKAEKSEELTAISDKYSDLKGRFILDELSPEMQEIQARLISANVFFGDSDYLLKQSARALMKGDERAALREYLQVSEPIANDFNDSIAKLLTPRFTFQDIMDNIKAGREPAATYTPDGYQTHPQSALINSYATANNNSLQIVATMQHLLEKPSSVEQWLKTSENEDRAYQQVEDIYGIERWETGELSRSARFYRKYAEDQFRPDSTYYIGLEQISAFDWKQRIQEEAIALGEELDSLLRNSQATSPEPFTMDQLIANFRKAKPLGLMADGTLHPDSARIEAAFKDKQLQLADYVDGTWLREGLPLSTLSTEEKSQQTVKEVVKMIKDSREVWEFDALLDAVAQSAQPKGQETADSKAGATENILSLVKNDKKALASYLNIYKV
jgi:hypothetical protein